ncbi:hypothetical protein D9757_005797 [Collybiopsis confluens]|uniref:Uncharacterized protein n=1 Tax=Collybiopsis confluens TaxID=2823264 RepID=A0A8H5MAY4_9AGAR|nr:hypothetical protein D9757_005797 [Collybiopsis confluens]
MISLTEIPIEIFLDKLLPLLPLADLLHLQCTNKFFATLCSDETLWRRKTSADFNFPDENTARTIGWKFIYLRLTRPRVFAWGSKGNGRLGQTKFPQSTLGNVSYPLELKFPGIRMVDLVAGGMSFQALDSNGAIHVWGALDGQSFALNRDGFSQSGKMTATSLKLRLPTSIRSISCGRLHSSSLDSYNQIWTFVNWGRPFRLVSHYFDTPDFTPIQVECGWTFSSALTRSGAVVVWWPFSNPMETIIETKMLEMDNEDGTGAHSTADGIIECAPWDLTMDPVILPSLPSLPTLNNDSTESEGEVRIIRIAGFDSAIIGLTNRGHVVIYNDLGEAPQGGWKYLSNFSEGERVRSLPAFSSGNLEVPANFKISHVSAHFRTFFAYSESIVLMGGDEETKPDAHPKIIPGLQNRSVISVVLGDYHFAAVTAGGKLLTWGQYSDGALGLGDPGELAPGTPGGFANEAHRRHALESNRGTPPNVDNPTEVRFDHNRKKTKDRFCISAAASGWHTGALPNQSDDDSDLETESETLQAYSRHRHMRNPGRAREQGETPPIIPGGVIPGPNIPFLGRGGNPFRIGFAGRGMHRGRGM